MGIDAAMRSPKRQFEARTGSKTCTLWSFNEPHTQEAIAAVAGPRGAVRTRPWRCSSVTIPKERDRADLTLPCFRLGKPPHEIAQRVVEAFSEDDLLASAEAAGPFVNFRIQRAGFIASVLDGIDKNTGRSDEGAGQTVVIDYSSPNIAKPLQFHHLRSAVIGQALCNLLRWRGYEVVGVNFLGDVGTAFGKLMVGIDEFGPADDADTLNERYVAAAKLCTEDETKMDEARAWAKRLEDGGADALELWKSARAISVQGFARVYELLGIDHTVVDGEQMYVESAQELVEQLLEEGTAEISEGAAVIETKAGVYLLRKGDGTTLYSTRDIAAARDRFERSAFAHSLYVVDVAQSHHFKLLFSPALKAIGHDWADRCRHISPSARCSWAAGARQRARAMARSCSTCSRDGIARAHKRSSRRRTPTSPTRTRSRVRSASAPSCSPTWGFRCKQGHQLRLGRDPQLRRAHRPVPAVCPRVGVFDPPQGRRLRTDGADLVAARHDDREWDLVRRLSEFNDGRRQSACLQGLRTEPRLELPLRPRARVPRIPLGRSRSDRSPTRPWSRTLRAFWQCTPAPRRWRAPDALAIGLKFARPRSR